MGEAAPKDNSMEEILASIRRIISSDDASPATGATPESVLTVDTDSEPREAPAGLVKPGGDSALSSQPTSRAGTLAGLARQLRGTRGLEPMGLEPVGQQPVGQQPVSLEPGESNPAPRVFSDETMPVDPPGPVSPAGFTDAGKFDGATGMKTPPGASPAGSAPGSAQSLAELAKSINEKIDAASRKPSGEAVYSGDGDLKAPFGASERPASMASPMATETAVSDVMRSDASNSARAASGSLADLVETMHAHADEAGAPAQPDDAIENADASATLHGKQPSAHGSDPEESSETQPDVLSYAPEAKMVVSNAFSPALTDDGHGADRPEAFKEALVSPATRQAVSSSMDRLKQAAADLSQAKMEKMLRPMLREWLDDNLPALVERMVQQEIDRITAQAGDVEEESPSRSKSA